LLQGQYTLIFVSFFTVMFKLISTSHHLIYNFIHNLGFAQCTWVECLAKMLKIKSGSKPKLDCLLTEL
jgi:hypothetical protein